MAEKSIIKVENPDGSIKNLAGYVGDPVTALEEQVAALTTRIASLEQQAMGGDPLSVQALADVATLKDTVISSQAAISQAVLDIASLVATGGNSALDQVARDAVFALDVRLSVVEGVDPPEEPEDLIPSPGEYTSVFNDLSVISAAYDSGSDKYISRYSVPRVNEDPFFLKVTYTTPGISGNNIMSVVLDDTETIEYPPGLVSRATMSFIFEDLFTTGDLEVSLNDLSSVDSIAEIVFEVSGDTTGDYAPSITNVEIAEIVMV